MDTTKEAIRAIVLEVLTELSDDLNDDIVPDEIFLDQVGLLGVSLFFSDIASVVAHVDAELDALDYEISTANAYVLLASLIQYGIDNQIIEPAGWEDVSERFLVKAQDFAGVKNSVHIDEVWDDMPKWATIVENLIFSWNLKVDEYSKDKFTNDERVQLIRTTLLFCRNKGWLDYNQPWFKRLIWSLHDDWVYFGGGFGNNMGSGSNPWSSGS